MGISSLYNHNVHQEEIGLDLMKVNAFHSRVKNLSEKLQEKN